MCVSKVHTVLYPEWSWLIALIEYNILCRDFILFSFFHTRRPNNVSALQAALIFQILF